VNKRLSTADAISHHTLASCMH